MSQPLYNYSHHKIIDGKLFIWLMLLVGLWLVVVQVMGFDFTRIPGGLADARFNNYILEHDYRWILGLDKDYWNARFFFPFPQTIAFSDNLLGSSPFYFIFRYLGFSRESAFQGWYVLGFILNYVASAYALLKSKFISLAAAFGAFFFTFGLPLLGQETHPQLLYRFAVPLTCLLLFDFFKTPQLRTLSALTIMFVWQFYLGIYNGFFLLLLILVLAVLLLISTIKKRKGNCAFCWPQKLLHAWSKALLLERILSLIVIIGSFFSLYVLLNHYYKVSILYGFSRNWNEIANLLPRWQSYFLAENAYLWKFSSNFALNLPMRHEHQLFIGLASLLLVILGILWRPNSENKRLACINLTSIIILMTLTLYFQGFSLYKFVWLIPGINSIRAVTRIGLVLMWPLAFFLTYVVDALVLLPYHYSTFLRCVAYALMLLQVVEVGSFTHVTYSKLAAQERIEQLRLQIPVSSLPEKPILFVASREDEPWYATEIDAMLLSQTLSWPTLNGYSGNFPPGYGPPTDGCSNLPERINSYIKFSKLSGETFYNSIIDRVVKVGLDDCKLRK